MDARTKHGDSHTKLYYVWASMLSRCNNPKHQAYQSYGGEGIRVCKAWEHYINFKLWSLEDYKEGLTLDRKDNDLNYSPENCRWVTPAIQNRNTRQIKITNTSGYRGIFEDSKRKGKWRAAIRIDYKRVYLGTYKTKLEAALAYDQYIKDNNLEHTTNNLLNFEDLD